MADLTATLDPSATDAAPTVDPYDIRNEDNKAAVLALVRDRMRQWSTPGREQIVRNGWRNLLFKRGQQWIVWDRGRGIYRPVGTKVYNGPRPVWNRYASTMNAFTANLARIEPTIVFRPGTDEPEDRATAEVAGRIKEVCDDECNTRVIRQYLAQWCGYTGGAWIEVGYDPSPEHGTRFVQDESCPACGTQMPPTTDGTCPMCQGPTQPAVDEAGAPVGKQSPIGRLFLDVATMFEMYFDAGTEDWKTGVREYVRKKSADKTALERRWGELAQGLTPDMGQSPGDGYQDSLATLASYQPEVGPGAGLLNTTRQTGRISEAYYWAMPTKQYPEGLLAIILGGTKVVHLGPLPYRFDGNQPFLPTVYFPIDPMPGSIYSKTPADDLALVAVTRNQLVANMLMTMDRMAWPIWLLPEGANVSPVTGTPGQIIRYAGIGPNPPKPERVQGAGLPNGATTWLAYIDHELEELSAAYAGTKGDRAPGVSAGISLQMIEDRKNQRFGGMYILWEHGWAEVSRMQLAIFKQFVTEPRLLKIQGKGSQWRVMKFLGSDLTGKIDVVAEAGSAAPRSTLAERAEVEQMGAIGAINLRDPEVQEKVLELYGHTDWLPGMKADAENAAKQIEVFEGLATQPQAVAMIADLLARANAMMQQAQAMGQMLPPITYPQVQGLLAQQGLEVPEIRPAVDGHAIFARELGNWLKGDASQRLPKPIQKLVELKHAAHVEIAKMQQMEAIQAQQGIFPTSGFLSNPGGQQGATAGGGQPSGSARMAGEQREMEANAQ